MRTAHPRLPGPFLVRLGIWLALFAAVPLSVKILPLTFRVEVLGCKTPFTRAACSQEYAALSEPWSERVLGYLECAERKEINPWLRDDIRQSWISLSTLHGGKFLTFEAAFTAASYTMYGCHPSQVWPKILARRQALLGGEYEKFWGGSIAPRKPVNGVAGEQLSLWNENGAKVPNPRAA